MIKEDRFYSQFPEEEHNKYGFFFFFPPVSMEAEEPQFNPKGTVTISEYPYWKLRQLTWRHFMTKSMLLLN